MSRETGDAEYTIYGRQGCTWCVAVVEFLEYMGPTFDYIDLDDPDNVEHLRFIKDNGFNTVPQVFLGDDHIGGYQDTVLYIKNL